MSTLICLFNTNVRFPTSVIIAIFLTLTMIQIFVEG
uniref:Uncharacterized protein n=1 Tax=uncultured bacterium BLR12 TaxID=506514 RepID=C0IND6_9BACT|nr:hypothetical protein AKSOIL_0207 [uncultured bacterium BLR12]